MKNAKLGVLPAPHILPVWLQADLRSDHAGEAGAIWIYKGILQLTKDADIQAFAREHLEQERQHFLLFDQWLPECLKSRILLLWQFCGWLLGCTIALMGRQAVYITIDAVERFVVLHYDEQIARLQSHQDFAEITLILQQFQHDEQRHRQEASSNCTVDTDHWAVKIWQQLIGGGSVLAVYFARRL
jgi:ubiquinone biosynthesis monooxygenase Coq7